MLWGRFSCRCWRNRRCVLGQRSSRSRGGLSLVLGRRLVVVLWFERVCRGGRWVRDV